MRCAVPTVPNIAPHARVARAGLSGYLFPGQGSPCVKDDRSRKRMDSSVDKQTQQQLLEKHSDSRRAPPHIQGPGRPPSIAIPVLLLYATPQRPRRTHCATNNIVRTALITGLLRHTPEIWRTNIDGSGTADFLRTATSIAGHQPCSINYRRASNIWGRSKARLVRSRRSKVSV
jgi:hypothetical protein